MHFHRKKRHHESHCRHGSQSLRVFRSPELAPATAHRDRARADPVPRLATLCKLKEPGHQTPAHRNDHQNSPHGLRRRIVTPADRLCIRNNLPAHDAAIVANRDGWALAVEGVCQGACMSRTDAAVSMAACLGDTPLLASPGVLFNSWVFHIAEAASECWNAKIKIRTRHCHGFHDRQRSRCT